MNTCALMLRRAVGAALIVAASPAVHGASLRVVTDVWGGSGSGDIGAGCTVYGAIPDLQAFFGGGGFRVLGGNTACGYVGLTADQTAAGGPLVASQTLPPVALDASGSSFQGSAGARAGYGGLGVAASGLQVGTSGGTSATVATAAAFFGDTLTASSPVLAAGSGGFVRYVFAMDGHLDAPAGRGGEASVQLNLQHAGGPVWGLGRLTVRAGDPAIFSAIDGSASGWALGVGTAAGAGTFGSTVHVPFFGDVDLPISWGTPWDLQVGLQALSGHTADASFLTSARLVDVQLFDALHNRVVDFSLSAASGTDYLAAVPEPQAWALWVLGLLMGALRLARPGAQRAANH